MQEMGIFYYYHVVLHIIVLQPYARAEPPSASFQSINAVNASPDTG